MSIARDIRESRLLTQADAAQALGIDPSWLSQVECGRKRPSIRLLQRMAELYRVRPSKLIGIRREYDKATNGTPKRGDPSSARAEEFGQHRRDESMEFQIAQIHASLAIVDELKGLRSAVLSLQNHLGVNA